MNLNFTINKNIIERYRSYGLSLEYLGSVIFVLIGLYEGKYDLLDSFDDGNREKRVLILYQYLTRMGFLERDEEENDVLYSLTERGIEFVTFVLGEVGSTKPEIRLVQNEVKESDLSEWIEDWINLFPSGKIDGRYLRTNVNECADRMRWFMKEYSYNKDTIMAATKIYVDSQASSPSGHTYTRNTSYFIFKGRSKHDRVSDLATFCQRYLDGEITEKNYSQRDVI